MVSAKFWGKVSKFFRVVPFRTIIRFDKVSKTFYSISGHRKLFHNFNTISTFLQVSLNLMFCIIHLDDPNLNDGLKIVRVMAAAVTVGLNMIALIYYWEISKPKATFIFDMNIINTCQNSIKARFNKYIQSKDSRKYEIMFEAIIHSSINTIGISAFFSFFDIDFFYFALPIPFNNFFYSFYVGFRYTANMINAWTIWYTLATMSIMLLTVIHILDLGIRCCEKALLDRFSSSNSIRGRYLTGQAKFVLQTQLELNVLQGYVEDALNLLAPFGSLLMEFLVVACNLASIKVSKAVPISLGIFLPLSAIVVAIGFIIFQVAATLYENSVTIREKLQFIVGTNAVWKRVVRSRKAFRVKIGTVCYVKRSTKTSFFYHCIDDTINAALVF